MDILREKIRSISPLKHITLIRKLILSYIVLIAIPTSIYGFYLFSNVKKNMVDDLIKTNEQTLQLVLNNFKHNTEICENSVQIIYSNKNLISYASTFDSLSGEKLWELNNNYIIDVGRIMNVNSDIYRLCIYSKGSYLVEAYPNILSESRIINAGILNTTTLNKGLNYWSLKHMDNVTLDTAGSNAEITSLFREVKDISNSHIGYIEAGMLTKVFFKDLYSEQVNADSFMCVIDEHKNILLNENNKMIKEIKTEPNAIKNLLKEKTIAENGNFELNINGKSVEVVYGYLKKLNIHVYKIISYDKLIEKTKVSSRNTILGIVIIISILSVVTYIITSVLLNKIRVMKHYMRKIQKGDLNVEIPFLGNDEIGELGKHFQIMMNRINELISVTVKNQEVIRETELKALSAQINSHFTYNTLDTIQMMAEVEEKYDIADSINLLGKLMRYGISWRSELSTFKDEINYIINYIALINIKYNNIVELSLYVEDFLLGAKVPRMLLQPIVENSVFYGIKSKGIKGILSIDAIIKEEVLIIEIFDNGNGIEPKTLKIIQENLNEDSQKVSFRDDTDSIGLRNVNERIKIYYGNEYGIHIESKVNAFTKVSISLPYSNGLDKEETSIGD